MHLLITGSRTIPPALALPVLRFRLAQLTPVFVHVGDARGVDAAAVQVCRELDIRGRVYAANWKKYGKGAGPRRNARMLAAMLEAAPVSDARCLALWDGFSRGTADMMRRCEAAGLRVEVAAVELACKCACHDGEDPAPLHAGGDCCPRSIPF